MDKNKKQDVNARVTPAQQLLQQELTRKEFMATLGMGVVSILGFSSIIHFLTGHKGRALAGQERSGYGSSSYGA